jgi:hypothetical protein
MKVGKELLINLIIYIKISLLLAKDTCGVQAPSGLILPGDMVKTRDYPWAGAFFDRDQFYCGGNLSNLTAEFENGKF